MSRRRHHNGAVVDGWYSRNEMKPSVSVFSGTVIQQLESNAYPLVRKPDQFFSVVRLYRFDPIPELVWEIPSTESRTTEILRLGIDREFPAVFVGGVFASKHVRSLIHGPIQSRSELIEKLTKFEREFTSNRSEESGLYVLSSFISTVNL